MPAKLSDLTLDEIRSQYLKGKRAVSAQILSHLSRDARRGARALYSQLKKRYEAQKKEQARLDSMLNFERILWKSGKRRIAGVDEAGMAPLAGPVVAAAVVFPPYTQLEGVDDSKRIPEERRDELARAIRTCGADVGIGIVEPDEIDTLNIYYAGLEAMRRAVLALPQAPDHLLVDAREIRDVAVPQNKFTRGDGINFSIAAASIIAKTHRDALMRELDAKYPGYGFAQHKGYPTPEHQHACKRLGPCAIHRRSFSFIRELTGDYSQNFYQLKEAVEAAHSPQALLAVEAQLKQAREELAEPEYRKLKLTFARRWKVRTA